MSDLLTTKEVAALIRKPEGTLRYWRSVDQGPASFHIGSTVVYERADIDAWVAEQKLATTRGGAA